MGCSTKRSRHFVPGALLQRRMLFIRPQPRKKCVKNAVINMSKESFVTFLLIALISEISMKEKEKNSRALIKMIFFQTPTPMIWT